MSFTALRKLSREAPSAEELAAIRKETEKLDDRAAAIIESSLVERALELVIRSALPPMDNAAWAELVERDDGPLSRFSHKIKLGYAMKLFEQSVRDDLSRIKNIRNTFAHAPKNIRFTHERISTVCKSFELVDDLEPARPEDAEAIKKHKAEPRSRFVLTARLIETVFRRHAAKS